MYSEETVSQATVQDKIVNINDFGSRRKEQIERWLEEEIARRYGERDSIILKNPLIRIITRFDALDSKAQHELYGYAKACILGGNCDMKLRDKFWSVIEKGGNDDGSWKDVEDFADTLLIREKTYKRGAELEDFEPYSNALAFVKLLPAEQKERLCNLLKEAIATSQERGVIEGYKAAAGGCAGNGGEGIGRT